MTETIAEAVTKLRNSVSLSGLDESATKQGVVLRLLGLVGWNPFDVHEVVPEYTLGTRRVDYALRLDSKSKVFIEVKKPSEDLQNHQHQLLDYCFQQGVKLAVLTNGRTWWFYLPIREGSWEQRRFLTIDLEAQEPDVVQSRITEFLSRDNVGSGQAVNDAEVLIASQQKINVMSQTLVQAWNEMIEEPDELLVDLISETTERICGFKPDSGMVQGFLAEHASHLKVPPAAGPPPSRAPIEPRAAIPVPKEVPQRRGFTGKRPSGFIFGQARMAVTSWIDILVELCDIVYRDHGQQFEQVLNLRGRKRPYFSRDGSELRMPRKLELSGIFVESNLNANQIVELSNDIIKLFGYSPKTLSISAD